jgi:hypothetical protein
MATGTTLSISPLLLLGNQNPTIHLPHLPSTLKSPWTLLSAAFSYLRLFAQVAPSAWNLQGSPWLRTILQVSVLFSPVISPKTLCLGLALLRSRERKVAQLPWMSRGAESLSSIMGKQPGELMKQPSSATGGTRKPSSTEREKAAALAYEQGWGGQVWPEEMPWTGSPEQSKTGACLGMPMFVSALNPGQDWLLILSLWHQSLHH